MRASFYLPLTEVLPCFALATLAACGAPGSEPDVAAEASLGREPDVAVEAPVEDAPDALLSTCGVRGRQTGRLSEPALDELSGLVAASEAGLFFAVNDSGPPHVYALDASGTVRATFELLGVEYEDVEDIALGAGPDGPRLFIGDIGDNRARLGGVGRAEVRVYSVAEPALDGPRELTPVVHRYRYPSGSRDAEALIVDDEGRLILFSKEEARSTLFRAPPFEQGEGELEELTTFAVEGLVTGADRSDEGLLIRTYPAVHYWPPGMHVSERVLGPSQMLPPAPELQGEAVAWGHEGGVFWTIAEGAGASVHRYACP